MGPYAKPMEGLLSFLFGGGRKKLRVVLKCIFGCDFLSPRTAIVSGNENYPSACMSCCPDDLALLLATALRSFSLRSENISIKSINQILCHLCMYTTSLMRLMRHNRYRAVLVVEIEIRGVW